MSEIRGLSAELAAFVVQSRWEDLPEDVRHAARRSLLNGFATALAGSNDSALGIARTTLLAFAGAPEATIVGRSEKADAMTAAFLNAAAMNVHDFDDTHLRTVLHPTAPVAPALLALAERSPMTGQDLLHSLALGIEAACRIGNAVSPSHYSRGWHITATCGVFGAAIAVGKVLALNEKEMVNALGIASAQSSGLVETLGFMAKSIGVGGACRGGLLAALLAKQGCDGPKHPLEGPRGFLQVTSDGPVHREIGAELGTRWELLRNIHKPYPCGVVLFPVIDACLRMYADHRIRADSIENVTLYGHPLLPQRADRPSIETGRESQVSAQHAVAVCLLEGDAGLSQFSDAAVQNPSVIDLRSRVRVREDPDCDMASVRMVVKFRNGETKEIIVDQARGTDRNPLQDEDIERKFRALAAYGAPECRNAEQLIEFIWNIDSKHDAGAVMSLACPST